MTLPVLGGILFVVLILMLLTGVGGPKSLAVVAALLGVVIVKTSGTFHGAADGAVSGLQSVGGFIVGLFQ